VFSPHVGWRQRHREPDSQRRQSGADFADRDVSACACPHDHHVPAQSHLPLKTSDTVVAGKVYNLTGPSGQVTFWSMRRPSIRPWFTATIEEPPGPMINVTGIAVRFSEWVQGSRIDRERHDERRAGDHRRKASSTAYDNGNTDSRSELDPVRQRAGDPDDGNELDNFNFGTRSTLPICRSTECRLRGRACPESAARRRRTHDAAPRSSAPEDAPNGLIDKLRAAQAIPNPPSAGGTLSLVPGSWRQSSN
jgi:hypothetical protein